MANQVLQDALAIARAAREGAVEPSVQDALDTTIAELESKIS